MKTNKLIQINSESLDKSSVFVEVNSFRWRSSYQLSLEELLKGTSGNYDISQDIDNTTLIIDENTLKVKVNPVHFSAPSVFAEKFIDQNISYYSPPKDSSTLSGMHMMTDSNYLYIWVGNRWKRTPLSEW